MEISETKDSPYFLLDSKTGFIILKGRSTLILTKDFYEPIIDIIKIYIGTNPLYTKMVVDLEFFNTSSSKYILMIFQELRKLIKMELKVEIDWYYDEDDDDMHEAGCDYSYLVKGLSFNLILKK
jgi:hypothetical protein